MKLPFLGVCDLPPEFERVKPGKEWGPGGVALWRSGDSTQNIIMACLSFLASQLEQSSIPAKSAFEQGDIGIFQHPPVMRPERRSEKNAVCLVFRSAKCDGLRQSGRYRQLVLGRDRLNRRVLIGAHRLICWAVHGASTDAGMVARHAIHGCEARLACCSPLHLSFGTKQQNRQDVESQKQRRKRQRCRNLHD